MCPHVPHNPLQSWAAAVSLAAVVLFVTTGIARAQDTLLARQLLDTLCSPSFSGRGYHHGGQQLAGQFVQKWFEEWGLQILYSSPCTVRVARYDIVELKAGRTRLQTGVDYSIPAGSGVGRGYLKGLPPYRKDSGYYVDKSRYIYNYNININRKNKLCETPRPIEVEWRKGPLIGSLTDSIGRTTRLCIDYTRLPKRLGRLRWTIQGELNTSLQHNIQGIISGSRYPDSIILLCAHYDHLGMLGRDCLYPGANDNASGTAMLMDLARHYAKPENRPAYSLLFVAFAAEEAGLLGSGHYVTHPPIPLEQHRLVINLDLMGGGSNGLMVVNGVEEAAVTELIRGSNARGQYLSRIDVRKNVSNSDHYPFTLKNVPAVFLYTQGDVTAYHHPSDRAEDLAWCHYTRTFQLLCDVLDYRMRNHVTSNQNHTRSP
ncbi:MAG: M28 family peptidase [Sphingomonadales bacterium]|nr:M28 family peptidase [Sphingomonadales bacterium]